MQTITFRRLQKADFHLIKAIALQGWLFAYNYLPASDLKLLVNNYYSDRGLLQTIENMKNKQDLFLVALSNRKIIGFCHVGVKSKQKGELYRLYIDLKYLGEGVGYLLLTKSEQFLKKKKCTKYSTFVNKQNKTGIKFYFREGFKHIVQKDTFDEFKEYGKVLWYMEKTLPTLKQKKGF